MTPGTRTSPGENKEHLDRRAGETTNHGAQVRHTRNFCETLRREPGEMKDLIQEFHQKNITKDQLREAFKKKLKSTTPEQRAKMGLTTSGEDVTDAEIEAFLSSTKYFENQFMSQIENDVRAKEKANEDMIDNCLTIAHDEYGDFDESELKKSLKKEDNGRLRTFLEIPKYRKTYIKKLPGSHTLTEKTFSDINFDEITRSISALDNTNPKKREIQEAWLKISQVAHPEKNLAEAFGNITHEGGPKVDIAGAYGAFFSDDNTLVSGENREKILNFLTRQYVPLVPFSVLEAIDPKTSKTFLTSSGEKAEFEKNLPSDGELAAALKKDKQEEWEKTYQSYIGGGKNVIATRNLPLETKIRILSQFGSVGKAEKMLEYYRGNPSSLRASTDNEEAFREKFKTTYSIDPEKLDTKSGFLEELTARLGHRVRGLEHFSAGCVMQWKTKNDQKEDITGYYIIDSVPSDDIENDNILTVRFLGNDQDPLSPSGLARHYTGADFYHYLDGCSEDGQITFQGRSEFDGEMEANTTEKKLPRYYTEQETQAELRNQFPETTEVQSMDSLNYEIDQILNPRNDNPKEAKTPEDRKLHVGMIFTKVTDKGIDTFQIRDIDEEAGTITLWDGWGSEKKSPKNKSIKEMSFTEFSMTIRALKKTSTELYRLPTGNKPFGIKEFNQFCALEAQYNEGTFKRMRQASIREEGGKNTFGKMDPKTGNFSAMPVIKVEGEKKDLYIESINETTVTYRKGTFKQGKYDKEKDKWTQDPEFFGSPPLTMSLAMLWAYLNESKFDFDKPIEKAQKKEPKDEGKLSWWNVLMHSHSLGVILHGDLWNEPFKAWEEQHHKDHAFAGKMTAALAMEKLNSGGGITGWAMNKMEWPSLMVADGNSSFQSYLNELVEKIDGMGSHHRTRLIKKWSTKEHFPSVKFMAAMCASMQIFGQLYPYDDGEKDPRKQEWFWYNQICHSIDPSHKKHPHMPPHKGEPWPESLLDPEKNMMTEVQACHKLFGGFQHPMLKNLGRRFQKYMNAGQDKLKSGGPGNLNERTTMEGKLEWMMGTVLSQKIPEAFGDATELWLKEGYRTEISTMPYAATLFGCREQQMLSPTQEHIKKQFQEEGCHVPMFVFMQNKNLGDVFRETGIAFAYTISPDCGKELEKLVNEASERRINGDNKASWSARFSAFWKQHGTELMNKLSGMRDPMLNLMMNDPQTFDEMLAEQTEPKKSHYRRLNEKKGVIRAYYNRLKDTYDSPTHVNMPRDKGFYSGDHFRYREFFDIGYPIGWIDWDKYIDGNLDKLYASGQDATAGDGIFNEIRGFLYDIPKLAEKMAEQMGFTGEKKKKYIHKISKGLFEKNRDPMKRLMEQKIKAQEPDAEYCSMTAMMLGIMDVRKLVKGGADAKYHSLYEDYYVKMKEVRKEAEEIEKTDYAKGIKYRSDMAKKWSEIVRAQIDLKGKTIDDIRDANSAHDLDDENINTVQKNTQARSGTVLAEKLDTFDTMARRKNTGTTTNARTQREPEDMALSA